MQNHCFTLTRQGYLVLLSVLILLTNCQKPEGPRKIEVLFLGHNNEHHHSEAYLPLLASALTPGESTSPTPPPPKT